MQNTFRYVLSRRSLVVLGIPSIVAAITFEHYRRLRIPRFQAVEGGSSLAPLTNSNAVISHINPNKHPVVGETLVLRLPSSEIGPIKHQAASPQLLLARFVHGFYDGWAFAIERKILTNIIPLFKTNSSEFSMHIADPELLPVALARFTTPLKSVKHAPSVPTKLYVVPFPLASSSLQTNSAPVSTITQDSVLWDPPSPTEPLPEVGTTFFGAFQIIAASTSDSAATSTAYVDIAFRTSARFAGVFRFEVERERTDSSQGVGDANGGVTLRLSCFVCNPIENRSPLRAFGLVYPVHRTYEALLFRDAVAGVIGR